MKKDTRKVTARKEKKTTANCELRFRLPRWRKEAKNLHWITRGITYCYVMESERQQEGRQWRWALCGWKSFVVIYRHSFSPVFCLASSDLNESEIQFASWQLFKASKRFIYAPDEVSRCREKRSPVKSSCLGSERNITDRGSPSTNNAMPHVRRERSRLQINLQSALQ